MDRHISPLKTSTRAEEGTCLSMSDQSEFPDISAKVFRLQMDSPNHTGTSKGSPNCALEHQTKLITGLVSPWRFTTHRVAHSDTPTILERRVKFTHKSFVQDTTQFLEEPPQINVYIYIYMCVYIYIYYIIRPFSPPH